MNNLLIAIRRKFMERSKKCKKMTSTTKMTKTVERDGAIAVPHVVERTAAVAISTTKVTEVVEDDDGLVLRHVGERTTTVATYAPEHENAIEGQERFSSFPALDMTHLAVVSVSSIAVAMVGWLWVGWLWEHAADWADADCGCYHL
jgi:hypothetical protein